METNHPVIFGCFGIGYVDPIIILTPKEWQTELKLDQIKAGRDLAKWLYYNTPADFWHALHNWDKTQ